MAKRILITGHQGYIGSVMAPFLADKGYEVTGLDAGYFAACRLTDARGEVKTLHVDLREAGPELLNGFDAVVHLGALSNDPLGNLNPKWTDEINTRATVRLARLAREAGVERFLFSSSCIMYGSAHGEAGASVEESAELDPGTAYARSKVAAEQALRDLATDVFSPVYLRNGTVYGLSPRMRFDTVLNSFAGAAVATGTVSVHSDGRPWRPVVHIEDVCRAFAAAVEAPRQAIHNEAFNVGDDSVNVRIGDLACTVADLTGAGLVILAQPSADQRTYRTSFTKIKASLPGFACQWNPQRGAAALVEQLRAIGLDEGTFHHPHFTRLQWLNHLRREGVLGEDLRWTALPAATLELAEARA
jgi:nucleoside-diphosphate-sugar epimerase